MRILRLWIGLCAATLAFALLMQLLQAAGFARAFPLGKFAEISVMVASVVSAGLVLFVIFSVRLRTRRIQRAERAVSLEKTRTPSEIVEAAFQPVIDAGVARDLVVAVIIPGRRVICTPTSSGIDVESKLYEVGSLTKPMTSELLAGMMAKENISASTTIGSLFSARKFPDGIANITVEQLATHQSGLPRLPSSALFLFRMLFTSDPYRWFSGSQLFASLRSARRTAKPGTYSNFAYAVLGQALAEANGADFESAITNELFGPLGLSHTHVNASGETAKHISWGRNIHGVPTPRWRTNAMSPAGGVSMTIVDGAKWLAAHINPPRDFRRVVELVTGPRATHGAYQIGLGWLLHHSADGLVAWHNGGTGGYSSFAAFNASRKIGVIAFAASSHVAAFDCAGFSVLRRCTEMYGTERVPHMESLGSEVPA